MNVQTGTVLVVDASPLLGRQLQQELAALGLAAALVEPAALPAAAAGAALAFIEIQLLHDNGFRLARELRASACKVVLLSGSGRRTDLRWGRRAGAVRVLTRPLRRSDLRQALADSGLLPAAAAGPQ